MQQNIPSLTPAERNWPQNSFTIGFVVREQGSPAPTHPLTTPTLLERDRSIDWSLTALSAQ